MCAVSSKVDCMYTRVHVCTYVYNCVGLSMVRACRVSHVDTSAILICQSIYIVICLRIRTLTTHSHANAAHATAFCAGLHFIDIYVLVILYFNNNIFKQSQHINGCSAAHVVVSLVSSEMLKCRSLTVLLDCLMIYVQSEGRESQNYYAYTCY